MSQTEAVVMILAIFVLIPVGAKVVCALFDKLQTRADRIGEP